MSKQNPTICRIVEFRDRDINDGKACPAIITGVTDDGAVSLHYFAPTGHGLVAVPVRHADDMQEGDTRSWAWPQSGDKRRGAVMGAGAREPGDGKGPSDAALNRTGDKPVTVIEVEPLPKDTGYKVLLSDGCTVETVAAPDVGSVYVYPPARNDQGRPGSTSAADKR